MSKSLAKFRVPTPDEQTVLDHLVVQLVEPQEQARFDALLIQHHYLHSAHLVGEHLRYVVACGQQWLALGAWSAAAWHLRPRDEFINWTDAQRRCRLPLLANNSRFLILPECHFPNLASRALSGMLSRLSADWQAQWGHPIVLVETFVDPQLFCGTLYQASGWSELGATAGFGRVARDYYQPHDRPKRLWVRELAKGAAAQLRAPTLPAAWAAGELAAPPRCQAKTGELRSLFDHFAALPEFRRKEALGYPLAGMLALIAIATFCGVVHGQRDLARFAATLSQAQLRALRFRQDRRTKRFRCPRETSFFRVLQGVDETALQAALLAWQAQVLGPAPDPLVALDGKTLNHAQGVELVSAFGTQSGRWLGTVAVAADSNEIPAGQALLPKVDLAGKIVVLDALHTQDQTARQIVFDCGGDYLLTVKDNQKGLHQTLQTLLTPQAFSPSTAPGLNH